MYSSITADVARTRRDDLLAEAARYRLLPRSERTQSGRPSRGLRRFRRSAA